VSFGYVPDPAPPAAAKSGGLARIIPSKGTLDHVKVGIEVLLLLLAVPWILRELARNPGGASRRAAAKHLAGS
jgi:hypothetical protein